jgi:hypothetical protein
MHITALRKASISEQVTKIQLPVNRVATRGRKNEGNSRLLPRSEARRGEASTSPRVSSLVRWCSVGNKERERCGLAVGCVGAGAGLIEPEREERREGYQK